MPIDKKKEYILKIFNKKGTPAVIIIDEFNTSETMEDFLNDVLMGFAPPKEKEFLLMSQSPVGQQLKLSKPVYVLCPQGLFYVNESETETVTLDDLITNDLQKLKTLEDQLSAFKLEEENSKPVSAPMQKIITAVTDHVPEKLKNPGKLLCTQNPSWMSGRQPVSTALQRRAPIVELPSYTRQEMKEILEKGNCSEKWADVIISVFVKDYNQARLENKHPMPTFRDVIECAKGFIKSGEIKKIRAEKIKNDKGEEREILETIHATLKPLSYDEKKIIFLSELKNLSLIKNETFSGVTSWEKLVQLCDLELNRKTSTRTFFATRSNHETNIDQNNLLLYKAIKNYDLSLRSKISHNVKFQKINSLNSLLRTQSVGDAIGIFKK